jgi:DNA-binding IclR family transcriptional regulator
MTTSVVKKRVPDGAIRHDWLRVAPAKPEASSIRAVRHAIAVLRTFSVAERVLGVNEIARRVGIHKSTVSRILSTLEEAGLVDRDSASGRYSVGGGMVALAAPLLASLDVRQVATPYLEDLAKASGETVSLSVWAGIEAVVVQQVVGPGAVQYFAPVGRRNPAHCTATGKALLANSAPDIVQKVLERGLPRLTEKTIVNRKELLEELAKVKRLGYAVADGEFDVELSTVACVVRDSGEHVVAVVAASAPSYRFTREHRRRLVDLVTDTAARLSSRLGYSAGTSQGRRASG